jgi:undecaprenyl-phosphate galactose phosphotransferase
LIKRNIWIKNGFDLFVALLILPFFLIIHAFIALAIKLDSKGSIFFRQERLGKNNEVFFCYKYRTMHENSEDLLNKYLKEHLEEVEYYKEFHKYKNDPRITKIGKFLRTTSFDELAQVINVFKSEMSLVGPRPYMLNESDKLGNNKHFILKVRPGITGLWQVSGRNNLTFKERNELEVWYIKNWSLWADFVIMIKTIKVVLAKVGAK